MSPGTALAALACLASAACAVLPAATGPDLPPSLQRVLDDYTAAWQARDAKALAMLFAERRTVVPNACPPVTDRAGVEACYMGSGSALHLRALDHDISENLAYIIGEYATTPAAPAAGKFVLTLIKDGDRWLIVADMDRHYPGPAPG